MKNAGFPGGRLKAARRFSVRFFCLLFALLFSACVFPSSVRPSSARAASVPDMAAVQQRLIELGYEIGTADGIIGAKSQAALRLVQTLLVGAGEDLYISGLPDGQTIALMKDPENETLLRTLLRGSWGSRVTLVQRRLADLGFLGDMADGSFGEHTETAVDAFEQWALEVRKDLIVPDKRLSAAEYDFLMSDLSVYGIKCPAYYDINAPENLSADYLYAKSAILIDAVSGDVLLEKDADLSLPPASTTKIVTLLTALSLCDPNQQITIPASAAEVPADSSLVPVYPGEQMTMRDLLYAMMIRSGNDAANAVGELCAGSVEAFVEKMNETARRLDMKNSHFVNPHGYSAEDHYTSARDLAIAAREGMTNPEFLNIVTCLQYVLPATSMREQMPISIKWEIFNPLSEYYIPHAAGIKSGYTSEAGFCYAGAYQEDGVTLIAVVLGCGGRNKAWTDLRRLFACGMSRMKDR